MADKKIKYSEELRRFLFELETLTDKKLWDRFEEEYADVLDWLWDQAYDKRVNTEHDWQAFRIQALTRILRDRDFDYPEQRAIIYYSRKLDVDPRVLKGRLYRRKETDLELIPKDLEVFNRLVDDHEDEIWDYSPTDLNFSNTSD